MTAVARRASLATTHSNYSHDWLTPDPWWDWVEETLALELGMEVFDPCPAGWTPDRPSGLDVTWGDGCYVNHPGARRSSATWWLKYLAQRAHLKRFIWCAFSIEQFRHMLPSALEMPGWLVAPRTRVSFIWGGPDQAEEPGKAERKHGAPMKQPGNWTAFWSTVEPARPPVDSIIIRTGG